MFEKHHLILFAACLVVSFALNLPPSRGEKNVNLINPRFIGAKFDSCAESDGHVKTCNISVWTRAAEYKLVDYDIFNGTEGKIVRVGEWKAPKADQESDFFIGSGKKRTYSEQLKFALDIVNNGSLQMRNLLHYIDSFEHIRCQALIEDPRPLQKNWYFCFRDSTMYHCPRGSKQGSEQKCQIDIMVGHHDKSITYYDFITASDMYILEGNQKKFYMIKFKTKGNVAGYEFMGRNISSQKRSFHLSAILASKDKDNVKRGPNTNNLIGEKPELIEKLELAADKSEQTNYIHAIAKIDEPPCFCSHAGFICKDQLYVKPVQDHLNNIQAIHVSKTSNGSYAHVFTLEQYEPDKHRLVYRFHTENNTGRVTPIYYKVAPNDLVGFKSEKCDKMIVFLDMIYSIQDVSQAIYESNSPVQILEGLNFFINAAAQKDNRIYFFIHSNTVLSKEAKMDDGCKTLTLVGSWEETTSEQLLKMVSLIGVANFFDYQEFEEGANDTSPSVSLIRPNPEVVSTTTPGPNNSSPVPPPSPEKKSSSGTVVVVIGLIIAGLIIAAIIYMFCLRGADDMGESPRTKPAKSRKSRRTKTDDELGALTVRSASTSPSQIQPFQSKGIKTGKSISGSKVSATNLQSTGSPTATGATKAIGNKKLGSKTGSSTNLKSPKSPGPKSPGPNSSGLKSSGPKSSGPKSASPKSPSKKRSISKKSSPGAKKTPSGSSSSKIKSQSLKQTSPISPRQVRLTIHSPKK